MKPSALLDEASAHVLGFDWLTKAVAPASPYGERLFAELRPFVAGQETRAQSRAETIAGFAAACDADGFYTLRSAFDGLHDVSGVIARASMGEVLDDPSFLELHRFCATIERLDALLAQRPVSPISNDAVRTVGKALAPGGRDAAGFYLGGAFDPVLERAREELARAQAELDASRGRETERVAEALGRDEIAGDEFIVMRADLRAPLPPGVRVQREAPTYLLCALELGEASLGALARRDDAAASAGAAEERVRARLSAIVREHATGIAAAADALGELDVLVAAARFAMIHRCTAPAITPEPVLAFQSARFLPLEEALAAAGRRFTPLDLELDDAGVLTGPNMGGKSVSLQTCGFVALCAAFGLPVPAREVRSALFERIAWLGTGRESERDGLLSSFAREVVELKAVLAGNPQRLLMLADEFARTTTPQEGKALLVALLERLREKGACGLLATHLAGVAAAAGVRHFAVRGLREVPQRAPTQSVGDALAALGEAMDYRIAEVGPGEQPRADAIALTALLGIDDQFVDAAYRALSQ
jgi:DNA mismatch repair protein MutS2